MKTMLVRLALYVALVSVPVSAAPECLGEFDQCKTSCPRAYKSINIDTNPGKWYEAHDEFRKCESRCIRDKYRCEAEAAKDRPQGQSGPSKTFEK